MTNKKITDLVELTTPTTDDVFPLVDIATNSTKKAQLANLPISTATQTALDAKLAKFNGTTYDINALACVTQAEYDALTPSSTTIYFIV